ncbi:hypothetical protein RYX36_031741 [Vicia faba]
MAAASSCLLTFANFGSIIISSLLIIVSVFIEIHQIITANFIIVGTSHTSYNFQLFFVFFFVNLWIHLLFSDELDELENSSSEEACWFEAFAIESLIRGLWKVWVLFEIVGYVMLEIEGFLKVSGFAWGFRRADIRSGQQHFGQICVL